MQCSRVVMIVGVVTCDALHNRQRDNVAGDSSLGATTGYAFFLLSVAWAWERCLVRVSYAFAEMNERVLSSEADSAARGKTFCWIEE
jgi:hypothetical protein